MSAASQQNNTTQMPVNIELQYFNRSYRDLNLQSHYTLLHIPDEQDPNNAKYEIYDNTRLVCTWDKSGGRCNADEFADVFTELKRHIQDLKAKHGEISGEFQMFEGRSLNSRDARTSPTSRRSSSPTQYRERQRKQSVFTLRFSDLSDHELCFLISHAAAEQMRRLHKKKSPESPSGHMKAIANMLSAEELKHYQEQKRAGKPLLPLQHTSEPKYKHAIPMHDDDGSSSSKYDMPIPMSEPSQDGDMNDNDEV
mmetsp:Transcript_1396/g.4793  ORF Transcript_1396/g.4793 Transcript_1396/m.4793 type:complete len:253 (-) Transcript_1396:283-1041(-)